MRTLLIILLGLNLGNASGQANTLISAAPSDSSNFSIAGTLSDPVPTVCYVMDTTETWRPERFWLNELNSDANTINELIIDEHHPLNHTYLFKDTALNALFSEQEKKQLSQKVRKIKSRKIKLAKASCNFLSRADPIKGFFAAITEPVLTNDKQYASVDITIYFKTSQLMS